MERAIEKEPSLILEVPQITKKMIDIIIEKDYIPNKEYFYKNTKLQQFDNLIKKAFQKDPSMIVFFNTFEITPDIVNLAYERGFIAQEEDLVKHPELCSNTFIMNYAVKENPKLIRYIKTGCYLKDEVIITALKKYKITLEDIKNNPDICKNNFIMYLLPEYKLYSSNLNSEEKKKAIIECLNNNKDINEENLPFFDKKFGSKVDSKKISLVTKILYMNIKDNDIDEQENYYNILDKTVDGILNIRYEKQKNTFAFSSGVSLRQEIKKVFILTKISQNKTLLEELVNKIYIFTNDLSKDYIRNELMVFYDNYIKTKNSYITNDILI